MSGVDKLTEWMKKNGKPSAVPEADELNSCDQCTERFKCVLSYMSCLDNLFVKFPISTFNGTDILPIKFDDMRKCKNLLKKCI